MPARNANTGPATEATKQYAAERAIDNPERLARAARIVRTALARKRLTIDELLPAPVDDPAGDAA